MDIIREIHEKISREQFLFVFRGDISEKNSLPLLTLLENEMKGDSFGAAGRKRLFMFVLESLQNISRHGEKRDSEKMPLVTYSRLGDGYRVITANLITSGQVPDLRSRLEKVSTLNIHEIKELYKTILKNSEFSQKGGAGLGLIEMAVMTGNRLDYDFKPAGNGLAYFILGKTVDSKGMGANEPGTRNSYNGDVVVQLEKMMSDNNIYMIWSGHFNPGIGEEVLSLAETRLYEQDVDVLVRKRVFSIMAEMLENVSKYSIGRELEKELGMPVLILKVENGNFIITTGNIILNDKIGELKYKLDHINGHSQKGLKDLFYSSLSEQSIDNESTGNLGLISMARKSGSTLNYGFQEIDSRYSYFMLTVRAGENGR